MPEKTTQNALMRNFGATVVARYGSKVLEFLVLSVAMREVEAADVGVVFFAQASGGLAFHLIDAGLYPVLTRRTARDELSRSSASHLAYLRMAGVVAITVAFAAITATRRPETAMVATGFFFVGGLMVVGEIPRSVLAGHERFGLLAKLNLIAKVIEAITAVVGLLAGYGLWAWLVGRALCQVILLATTWPMALGRLPEDPARPSPRALLREGMPFWLSRISGMISGRLATIVVSLWVSFEATAQLGIATRIVGAATTMVGAMTTVLYPALARENRREITRKQIGVALFAAVALVVPVVVTAPWLVHIIVGHPDEETVKVLRIMAPVISLMAISRPLKTWLQAMQKERALLFVAIFNSAAATAFLLALVPSYGLWGAAMAWPLRGVVTVATTGLLTIITLREGR